MPKRVRGATVVFAVLILAAAIFSVSTRSVSAKQAPSNFSAVRFGTADDTLLTFAGNEVLAISSITFASQAGDATLPTSGRSHFELGALDPAPSGHGEFVTDAEVPTNETSHLAYPLPMIVDSPTGDPWQLDLEFNGPTGTVWSITIVGTRTTA